MGKLRDKLESAQLARESFESQRHQRAATHERKDRDTSLTVILAGLAAFYLAIRFGATRQLDAINDNASMIFEISLVALTVLLLKPRLTVKALATRAMLISAPIALIAGFAILKIARLSNISVPFDVHDMKTVIELLVIAPVLEELIFRFMLFQPIQRLTQVKTAMIVTSLLFSYSHLHAIWFVPPEYDKFLLYQTVYTFPLALACAWMVGERRSLLSSMLVHGLFNLGFFLALWI